MISRLISLWSLAKDRSGSAAVEFAIIGPALLMMTIGVIDVGRLWHAQSTLRHSASEAARYASIRGADATNPASEDEVIDYVRNRAVGLQGNDVGVTVTWAPDNNSGSSVTIQLQYPLGLLLTGFLPIEPIALTAASTLVIS